MSKKCEHELETAVENITPDNFGIKVAGMLDHSSNFKFSRAYFIVVACQKCKFKEYKRLVLE